jgi:hypothetical protein
MTEARRRRLWLVIAVSFGIMIGLAAERSAGSTSLLGYLRLRQDMSIREARDRLGAGEELSLARVPMLESPDGALRPAVEGDYFHLWTYPDASLCAGFRSGRLVSKKRLVLAQGE